MGHAVMKKSIALKFIALAFILTSSCAHAFCFDAAGKKYGIDPLLLRAIAKTESGLNPRAVNYNKSGGKTVSADYGLMQINSKNMPKLISMGVIKSKEDLLDKPCLNVQIGAYILAGSFKVCNLSWECLGSYNAGFVQSPRQKSRRNIYADKVYKHYRELLVAGRN